MLPLVRGFAISSDGYFNLLSLVMALYLKSGSTLKGEASRMTLQVVALSKIARKTMCFHIQSAFDISNES